jgi:hypothetical protein
VKAKPPKSRLGRPAEFKHRVRLQVFLERTELVAIRRAADAAGVSASSLARQAIATAVAARKGALDER